MEYRLPDMGDRRILDEYVQEHFKNGETSITAGLELESSDYADWMARVLHNAAIGENEWGRSVLQLCLDGETLVGLLSIRYELPKHLAEIVGHIGYGVRPSERRKGHAITMLRHALSFCRERGLKVVILGCYKDNLASAAVIRKAGGVLFAENDNYEKGRTSQYFSIRL